MIEPTYLSVKRTTSRGRDTYGYNICTVTDQETGKKYRCNGGGYDLLGRSVGNWLEDRYQDELLAIKDQAYTHWIPSEDGPWDQNTNRGGLYGMNYYGPNDSGRAVRVSLDGGACGLSRMEAIAKAIGIKLTRTYAGRNNHTTGYIVSAL